MNLKNNKKIFISLNGNIGSGILPDLSIFYEKIAVDGGAAFFKRRHVLPDVIIGDLDSVQADVVQEYRDKDVRIIKYPSKKDFSDFELAIKYIKENYEKAEITIAGFYSDHRIDHFLFNIEMLKRLSGFNVRIISERFIMYSIDSGDHTLEVIEGSILSLLPLTQDVFIEKTEGLEYSISECRLIQGSSLSLSNITKTSRIFIKIREGQLLVLIPKEKVY